MKKFYSILFCLMAMSITFSSCSKGGDDDFLPNGGGTEVNGGSTQPLTDNDIVSLNNAYNSGNTTTFINALESKGCIEKGEPTRSGDSDAKYVLTEKGKEYFKSDLFEVAKNKENAYRFMCYVFQGIYFDGDRYMQEDMYGEYKWVSLDNPNVWFECSHKEDKYDEDFVMTWHKDNIVFDLNFKDNTQIDNFDYNKLSIREDLAYAYYKRKVSNDEPLIFSQLRGSDDFYSSGGYYYTSSKDNICIVNISTEHKYDIVQGLYIRVPKTNK
ncbi:MAG: hypothetical protein J5932_08590 [Prevotella sp.]|nr:hypothetical protein [Prevotella sp.]